MVVTSSSTTTLFAVTPPLLKLVFSSVNCADPSVGFDRSSDVESKRAFCAVDGVGVDQRKLPTEQPSAHPIRNTRKI